MLVQAKVAPAWAQSGAATLGSGSSLGSGFRLHPDSALDGTHALSTPKLPSSAKTLRSLQERVFDNAATLKVETWVRAMHMHRSTRSGVFARLDQLLDPEELDDGAELIRPDSFVSFLRFILAEKVSRVPAFGINSAGELLAAWWSRSPEKRIYGTFKADDIVEIAVITTRSTMRAICASGTVRRSLLNLGASDEAFDHGD